MSDENYIDFVKSIFKGLKPPKRSEEIHIQECPEMENGLLLGRSKNQYHIIFLGIDILRSNHIKVQNKLAYYRDYHIKKGETKSKTEFISLGVRTAEPYLDFISTVVGRLHEIKFVSDVKMTPQEAMYQIEDHILLLLNNLATNESMLGLLGELYMIKQLYDSGLPIETAVEYWTGHQNTARDFHIQNGEKELFFEVKTTTNHKFPRSHHIGGFSQVIPEQDAELYIASIGCESSSPDDGDSVSIESLADYIAENLAGEYLENFKLSLLTYGSLDSDDKKNYICFDIDWSPRPNWSRHSWKIYPFILDTKEA